MTVEVQTPAGVVRASSVLWQQLFHQNSKFAPPEARGATTSKQGDAVVVEVLPGRYLFVLLKGLPKPYQVFYPGEAPVRVAPRLESLRETRILSDDQYPWLVTFSDLADPTTIQRVDPRNLGATFGDGISLKRITLGLTGERVTDSGISKILPWIDDCERPQMKTDDGDVYTGDFIAGGWMKWKALGCFFTKKWR